MRTIEQTFQQLTALITDQTRDLALAMAELRSVAQQRDALKNPAGATIADGGEWTREEAIEMHRRKADELLTVKADRDNILETMQRNSVEYIAHHKAHRAELDTARADRDKLSEALERNCVQYVQKQQALIAERDRLKSERDNALAHLESLQACLNSAAKAVRVSEIDANTARQSLRAAEADLAETEGINSDLRTVNKRLVTDLAAAMDRADTAEAILRANA